MYQIKPNDQKEFNVETDSGIPVINGIPVDWDVKKLPDGSYSILANGKSYIAVIDCIDRQAKEIKMRINGNTYNLTVREPMDLLLEKMGLDLPKAQKAESLKAPMPGLVLKVLVGVGEQIKKGAPVLILEAMKMENVFKATADALVKSIKVKEGDAVEKGAVLLELE